MVLCCSWITAPVRGNRDLPDSRPSHGRSRALAHAATATLRLSRGRTTIGARQASLSLCSRRSSQAAIGRGSLREASLRGRLSAVSAA